MASADVTMRLFGSPEDAERAIVRLERRYDSLENKVKQVSRTSRTGVSAGTALIRGQVTQLATLASSYLSVQAAVGLVRQGYQQWLQDIENVSEALAGANRELSDQLLLSGDLAQGQQLQEFFRGVQGATQSQAQGIFNAISEAAPDISQQQRKQITEAIAPLEGVLSEQNTELAGAVAANLAQVLPDRSAGDLADLSVSLLASLGGRAPQAATPGFERALRTLEAKGVNTEESLAFLTEGINTGARGSTLATLAGRLQPGQGLDALFSGEVQLGQEQQDILNLIQQQRVTDLSQTFRQAQEGDAIAAARQQARQFNRAGLLRQSAQVSEEDVLEQRAANLEALQSVQQFRLSQEGNPLRRGGLQLFQFAQRQFLNAGLDQTDLGSKSILGGTVETDIALGGGRAPRVDPLAQQQLSTLQQIAGLLGGVESNTNRKNRPINRDAQTE